MNYLRRVTKELDYRDIPLLHFLRPKYVLCHSANKKNYLDKISSLQYGNFTAVLEDHVKHRATFTFKDSMSPFGYNLTHAFYSKYGNKTPYEGQVYGHLSVAEDVKHFLANPVALTLEKNAVESLKEFGKPIYNSVTNHAIFNPIQQLVIS